MARNESWLFDKADIKTAKKSLKTTREREVERMIEEKAKEEKALTERKYIAAINTLDRLNTRDAQCKFPWNR